MHTNDNLKLSKARIERSAIRQAYSGAHAEERLTARNIYLAQLYRTGISRRSRRRRNLAELDGDGDRDA